SKSRAIAPGRFWMFDQSSISTDASRPVGTPNPQRPLVGRFLRTAPQRPALPRASYRAVPGSPRFGATPVRWTRMEPAMSDAPPLLRARAEIRQLYEGGSPDAHPFRSWLVA